MDNTANIKAVITADDRASGKLNEFGRNVEGVGSRIGDVAKRAAEAVALATGAAIAFGVSSVKAYEESERAQAQLEHAVVNVTHATQAQLKATEDLATSLMNKGVLDDDVIKVGLAQLSTFGLSNDAVRKLGGSLADLTVNQFGVKASGEQAAESANMMARALHGQFGILERSGIRFSDAQKQMILYGTETQKVTAMNQGFQQNLKYTNEVALTTTEGKLAHLSVAFGNFKESVGQAIVNGLTPFATKAVTAIASVDWNAVLNRTIAAISNFVRAITDTYNTISNYLGPGISRVIQIIQEMGAILNTWLMPSLRSLFDTLSTRLIPSLVQLYNTLEPGLTKVLQVVGAIIGGAVVGALWLLINVLNVTISIIGGIVRAISDLIGWLGNIAGAVYNARNAIMGAFSAAVGPILAVADAIRAVIDLAGRAAHAVSSIPNPVSGISHALSGFTNLLPHFAQGGTVPGPTGAPTLAVVHGGETVIPVNQSGGGGQTIIHISPQIGIYAGTPTERRKLALTMLDDLRDLANQKNTTVSQLLGANRMVPMS